MDLQSAINDTCPSAFSGASGGVFLNAVLSLVAAHCAVVDEEWPEDRADYVLDGDVNFDFIIIGAGTAGSLVAGRLADLFPTRTVLVVEAGGDPGLDSEVPSFLYLNQNTKTDWGYKTVADKNSCLGFKGEHCYWSKGRGIGGSSAINAMLYIRGHPEDYDEWSSEGNTEWSYTHIEKYFERIDNTLNVTETVNNNPWYDVIKKAWNDLGFNKNDLKESVPGTKFAKLLVRDGRRLNTAKMFMKNRKNLFLMKNTNVEKILFDSTNRKTAVGVRLRHYSGIVKQVYSSEEIILSAGSIATPHILMLSGVGPKEELNKLTIQCLKDLPVGKNLQDHILLPLFLTTNQHFKLDTVQLISSILQYMQTRTGPLTTVGIVDLMGFLNIENKKRPDLQFHHTYFPKEDAFSLEPYLKVVQYKEDLIKQILELNKQSDLLGIYPTLLHPKSRGEIVLQNKNPIAHPIIKANYFKEDKDMSTLIESIKFVRKLESTKSFKMRGIKLSLLNLSNCPDEQDTEAYWVCYIKHMASTIYHPVGTCKMGTNETLSVVSPELLVHGVKRLRVVDASIMPSIPGANTVATTLMIAEKAVDIISRAYSGDKDEL